MIVEPSSREAWIPASRQRQMVVGLLGLVMVASAVALILLPGPGFKHVGGWIGAIFFGCSTIVIFYGALAPGRRGLQLDETGFAIVGQRKTSRYSWADIETFAIFQVSSRRFVGFTLKDGARRTASMNLARSLSGVDGSLPNHFDIDVETLISTLDGWRQYYAGSDGHDRPAT